MGRPVSGQAQLRSFFNSMHYYYLNSDRTTAGPSSLDQIRELARTGKIEADPLVAAVGTERWEPLSQVTAAASASATTAAPAAQARTEETTVESASPSTVLARAIGRSVEALGRRYTPERVTKGMARAVAAGHWLVLSGVGLTVLAALLEAVRTGDWSALMLGLAAAVGVALAQFAALRFLSAGDGLLASNPTRVGSKAFFEIMGVGALFAAVGSLLLSLAGAGSAGSILPLVPGVLWFFLWVLVAGLAFNPASLNIEVGAVSAGEEAIGVISFFFKIVLRLAPLLFALLAFAGALMLVLVMIDPRFGRSLHGWTALMPGGAAMPLVLGRSGGLTGAMVLIWACLVPLVAWATFLMQYLLLDLVRAVLALPRLLATRR